MLYPLTPVGNNFEDNNTIETQHNDKQTQIAINYSFSSENNFSWSHRLIESQKAKGNYASGHDLMQTAHKSEVGKDKECNHKNIFFFLTLFKTLL